jgi:signal transduction histidine kinase
MGDMGEDWPARLWRTAKEPLAVRAGVALLALAGAGQAIAQAADHGGGTTGELVTLYGLPLCVLALASTLPLLLSPLPSALVIAAANVLVFVSFSGPTVAGMIALMVAAARLGAAGEARGGPGNPGGAAGLGSYLNPFLALALGLPFLVIALAEHGSVAAVLLAALVPAAAGAGLAVRSSRQAKTYSAAGEALAGTLVAHTARGERARIARELHDVVAHHISMIAVLAETGRLTTPGLPEAGARRFAEIGDTARGGLTEMRRLLGVLREDAADAEPAETTVPAETAGLGEPGGSGGAGGAGGAGRPRPARQGGTASRHPQPGLAQLAELVDAAREASGATARLIISGPVTPLDPGVELAAYRIVQEALTNARRHAAGAAIDVELRYAPDVLRLRVRDNGPGPGAAQNSGGHGLLGMRERAFSVGGSLYTGAAPGGGFLVEGVLPAAQDADGTRALASGANAAAPAVGAGTTGTPRTASGASAGNTASGASAGNTASGASAGNTASGASAGNTASGASG